MSKYSELIANPVKNTIEGTPKKVLISLVSCMCDNRYQITFESNEEGSYRILTHGNAFSNFQMNYSKADLLWEAEDGKWNDVVKMINSGTATIESIRTK